jgi:hypothetical protein
MEGSSLITPRKFRANPGILALNLEKPKNYLEKPSKTSKSSLAAVKNMS